MAPPAHRLSAARVTGGSAGSDFGGSAHPTRNRSGTQQNRRANILVLHSSLAALRCPLSRKRIFLLLQMDVRPLLVGRDDVELAVAVDVGDDELRADAGVHVDRIRRE